MDALQISPVESIDDSIDTSRVYVKRLPEDDGPFDLESTPAKRQIIEPGGFLSNDMASSTSHALHGAIEEPQLSEKSPEDLVFIIQQMQHSHAQQVAQLRDQYTAVSRQLEQLKALLNSHFTTQLGSIHLLQSVSSETQSQSNFLELIEILLQNIASLSSPKRAPPPSTVPHPVVMHDSSALSQAFSIPTQPSGRALTTDPTSMPAPHYVVATPTPQRHDPGTPSVATPISASFSSSTAAQTSATKSEMKIIPSSVPNEPPTVEPSHIDTVPEVWEEFRYGRAGNMSVEKLDVLWGPRWRQDPKLRTWYQRRKVISDRIKLYMADGISEQDAVMEVEKMRRGRTLNWVSRILLDDRKETRKQRKVAAQAATAAREALHGMPAI